MKYYKIYAKTARVAHPVEELNTWEKTEVLNDVVEYQCETYIDTDGTTMIGNDETKALLEMLYDEENDETEIYNKLYENIGELVTKEFTDIGSVSAGDWGLVALEDGEDPWDHRPNAW